MGERKALHAYVSDQAHEQWHGYAAEQGVSVSAILEALAPHLTNPAWDDHLITTARDIDTQRRRRSR